VGNMGGVKYNMPTGGYSSQQVWPFSPSTGPPPGSIGSGPGGMRIVGGMKPNDNLNKHLNPINQAGSVGEEGLLDKFMTESHNRSIASTPPTDPSKVIMAGSRLMETNANPDHGADTLKNHNLTISPANKSPIITSSEK